MKIVVYCQILLGLLLHTLFAQSIDDPLSQTKMRADLEVFQNIRIEANSGLYKYRTKEQMDSIYHWADQEIEIQLTKLVSSLMLHQERQELGSWHLEHQWFV